MSRSVSDEEIQLRKRARRRLVGAVVLVTVAVMILPMVLDQEPTPVTQDIAITIPPKGDAGSFAPKAVPAAEPPRAAPPPAARPAPKPAEPAAEAPRAPVETEKPKAQPPTAEKPAEPAPSAAAKAKPDSSGAGAEAFVVQLDAFSNPENAKQQQKKLSAAGITSYTETVKTQKGELTRVRVGPYSSRQPAEQMRDRLAKLGVKSVVVPR